MRLAIVPAPMRPGLIALLLALGPALPAVAASWVIAPEESRVEFDFRRGGRPNTGRFARFVGEGIFDPARLETAALELRIETASVEIDDSIVRFFATTEEYFDSESYPHVVYRLLRLTAREGARCLTEGELTIRRTTGVVTTPVTLEVGDETIRASGTVRVPRKDFHFGVGPLSLLADLGPEIVVRFVLVARRVR